MTRYVEAELQYCGGCYFKRKHADDREYCHRYPPTPLDGVYQFPPVKHDDWCGEYKREERRERI